MTVADQNAFEFLAQNIKHDFVTAAGFNRIHRQLFAGEDPQPSRKQANPPAGLVAVYHRTCL
jgi:hypothetical protein